MACALNGTSQYLSTPVSSDFEFGTGDFTVSIICRFTALGDSVFICLGDGAAASPTVQTGWLLRYYANNLYWYRYSAPTETFYTFAWIPSTNVNYNIVATRTGTSLKVFVNGSQIGSTATSSVSYNRVNSDNLNLGRAIFGLPGVPYYVSGSLSEVGIWKAGLTDGEITALSKGFTPDQIRPQSLTFYLPLVSSIQDLRGGKVITNNNGATVANHPRVYT